MKKVKISLIVFAVLVYASGWIGVLIDSVLTDQPKGQESLGMGVWLALPLIYALLSLLFTRGGLKDIGLRPLFKENVRWYFLSIIIYPIVTAVVVIMGVVVGWIDASSLRFNALIAMFGGALLAEFIKNIFEEGAWRGFLTHRLLKFNLSDWKLYLIIGLIWGPWHIPYFLVFLPDELIQIILPSSRVVVTLVAILVMLSWTVMYTELYRITRSIWPCVLMHAMEDALTVPLVVQGLITIFQGKEILINPNLGLIPAALYLGVGLAIRAYRRNKLNLSI